MADRAFDLAWTHSQVTLRHLNATEAEAQLYGRMASALIYADPARRANTGVLLKNRRGQSGLWSYGISGDAPLVLLHISDMRRIEIVRQLIQAHSYWRMKGLTVELVILNEDVSVYRQSLQDQITSLISSGIEAQMLDKPGGIFVRRLEQIPNDGPDCSGRRKWNVGGTTRTEEPAGAVGRGAETYPIRFPRFAQAASSA